MFDRAVAALSHR